MITDIRYYKSYSTASSDMMTTLYDIISKEMIPYRFDYRGYVENFPHLLL